MKSTQMNIFKGKKNRSQNEQKINKKLNKRNLHKKKNDVHERTMMMMF